MGVDGHQPCAKAALRLDRILSESPRWPVYPGLKDAAARPGQRRDFDEECRRTVRQLSDAGVNLIGTWCDVTAFP